MIAERKPTELKVVPTPGRLVHPGAADVAAARPSTVAINVRIVGDIAGPGDLRIEGIVRGNVRVARLIIDDAGALDGDVVADYVEVRGSVTGDIAARHVRVTSTGHVDGRIVATELSVDDGAWVQGRIPQGGGDAPSPPAPGLFVVTVPLKDAAAPRRA